MCPCAFCRVAGGAEELQVVFMVGSASSLGEEMVNRHVAKRKVVVASGAFALLLPVEFVLVKRMLTGMG